MADLVCRSFDAADETRPFLAGKGRLDLLETDGGQVGRGVFEPGWKWSEHIKPLAGTESCESAHTGYVVSGRIRIVMDGGDAVEAGPGDFIQVASGHDAWVLGDEPCVLLDWTGYGDYARPPSG
ncbi:cupin domain-containing protein [Streptomyces antarcticus]|uniref:cupin domain-containing protein n=1 Tax=Streptomyces antarcticus TaxID=2996458 RepID=UPI0022700A0E|nr:MULTISPECIES: cupin domain-containing protein [unclassified Streptomyces]MCY0944059.1 cupin domain-containing protein [Streptomyces sp. H34-AA3]MCY0952942.1 cupin domain-containing protein [Streptomyces sp. H27-S2]MCZ4082241.1 cupin domain-containing protein [Streptomyces sp. H34-S5]